MRGFLARKKFNKKLQIQTKAGTEVKKAALDDIGLRQKKNDVYFYTSFFLFFTLT